MILRLALRSLLTHPIRTLVLACGFGLGVGVMAMLLGVGEVILDQARSPAVSGGGDVVIASSTGDLPSARWILSSGLRTGGFEDRVSAASPSRRATLYLVRSRTHECSRVRRSAGRSPVLPFASRAAFPALERAIGDPETSLISSWTDAPSDAPWSSPDPGAALAALDRFHPIPDVPARAESWAEWLYFNGHAGDTRFYLTFLVGPKRPGGRRIAGVRLQLDRAGQRSSYSQSQEVNEADVLSSAPNLTIGSNRVRLDGMRYRITLDLPAENRYGRALPATSLLRRLPGVRCRRWKFAAPAAGYRATSFPSCRAVSPAALMVRRIAGRSRRWRRLSRSQLGILEGCVVAMGPGSSWRSLACVWPHSSAGGCGRP